MRSNRTLVDANGAYRIAALVVTAACSVGIYQFRTSLRGPSPSHALARFERWSRHACALLGLDAHVHGQRATEPVLYVSNHRSYLDIPVLAGVLGTRFLSRADLAQWPIVGTAAQAIGAVFVDRDDAHGRAHAARVLARSLRRCSIVVFPEGTTHGNDRPASFHPGVFRLAHRLNAPVVPVTIRYSDRRVYWTDESTIGQHLRTHVLTGPRVAATVHIGEPVHPAAHDDPETLTQAVYREVCRPLDQLGELV
jgi:1-acyl-sn-glycerol-3-phosphate acyltransferase